MKTLEKCKEFYKKMRKVHNKFQIPLAAKIKDFPDKDQHLKFLQDRLLEDEQYILKMEVIKEEDVKNWIAQASISNDIFEYLYKLTPPKVTELESQLDVHEVNVRLLEPIDYRTITGEGNAWGEYISRPAGPT